MKKKGSLYGLHIDDALLPLVRLVSVRTGVSVSQLINRALRDSLTWRGRISWARVGRLLKVRKS